MSGRLPRGLAWGLVGLSIALTAGAAVFLILGWSTEPPAGTFGFRGFGIIFAWVFSATGSVVASRRPANPIGWLLLATGVGSAFQELAQQYALVAVLARPGEFPGGEFAAWITAWIWVPGTALVSVFMPLLFPSGTLPSPRWRIVAVIGASGVVVATTALALIEGPLENFQAVDNPFGVLPRDIVNADAVLLLYMAGIIGAAISLIVRFRGSRGDERQQVKLLAFAIGLVAVSLSISFFTPGVVSVATQATTTASELVENLVVITFALIPVAVGLAVLKYRLYDIDLVVSKAVAYGILGVFITSVYVAIVVGVGTAVGSRGNPALSAVAAAIVALAFQPVRRRAQRLANRVVYGERATPYEVLSEFSDRLAEAYAIEDVLPRMARTLAEGVGATAVTILLGNGRDRRPVASYPTGSPPTDARTFEVRHQGDPLGAIAVSMPMGEPLGPVQEKLATDVATQAGLVLRNAALIEDLRASRQRLVAAQDEERRRIERNIHDGAQQQLVALGVKAGLLERLAGGDPKVEQLAAQLRDDAQVALDDLRDLARGIYPPLLADHGLAAALESQARKTAVPTTIATDGVGRFGPDIEAAVYFSCLEALQNVAKYAKASRASVHLEHSNGSLTFEVADDGAGFEPDSVARGSGLQGMADRLAALGGELRITSQRGRGTTVSGRLPVGRLP